MTARRPDVEVSIDALVLHGFAPAQRAAIAEAIRTQLAVELAGWRPAEGELRSLDGGAITVDAAAGASRTGRAVATQLAQALRGAAEVPR